MSVHLKTRHEIEPGAVTGSMPIGSAHVHKSNKTTKRKVNDHELVIRQLKIGITVDRDQMAELAGVPLGMYHGHYNEQGAPFQHESILLTKRELVVSGKITRTIEGEKEPIELVLPSKKTTATKIRFVLEPFGAAMICELEWVAGDESGEVRLFLDEPVAVDLELHEPQIQMFPATENKPAELKSGAAADALAPAQQFPPEDSRRKGKLDDQTTVRIVGPGVDSGEMKLGEFRERVARVVAKDKTNETRAAKQARESGAGDKFMREAQEHARKHPRKEPPKPEARKDSRRK
jgi:hypothetical protein